MQTFITHDNYVDTARALDPELCWRCQKRPRRHYESKYCQKCKDWLKS